MKAGSVIVDIAAEQGGNCELTKAGETVLHGGVKIVGPVESARLACRITPAKCIRAICSIC